MHAPNDRTVCAVTPAVLREHLAYTAWANRRLLHAAAGLSADELGRDFGTADHSVIGTLAHIYGADRAWLSRLEHAPFPGFVTDAERALPVLERDWPELQERWRAWAETLTDESAAFVLDYKDVKGNSWREPVWQILLHVVNHGTHHRGQVAGFLRSMGHKPPFLDLIAYYRGQ